MGKGSPMLSRFIFLFAFLLSLPLYGQAPKKLLLLAQGPDGHPPETHEYEAGLKILEKMLSKTSGVDATLVKADEPWRDGPELLSKADGCIVFLSEGAKFVTAEPKRLAAFQKLAERGGGLGVLHWGMGTKEAKNIEPFVKMFGACHGGPDRKFQVLSTTLKVVDFKHPMVAGVQDLELREEFYYNLKVVKDVNPPQPILTARIDGKDEMVGWAWERAKGRSFGFTGLHFHENWRHPEYRRIILQGTLWSLGLPSPKEKAAFSIEK